MDPGEYDRWWPLHLKTSRGEQLSAAERQIYDEGARRLQGLDNAISAAALAAIEAAGRRIADLEQQQRLLRSRRDKLDSEIASAEAALREHARVLLGAKE